MSERERADVVPHDVEIPIEPRCPVFERWLGRKPDFSRGLEWASQGMGALRVTDPPYDGDYFEKYVRYARTPMGRAITAHRIELVRQYAGTGHVVDVGIGCGDFIETRGGWSWGYDVNPAGVAWLAQHGRWRDPYESPVTAVTLWDVLEHIPEPELLLRNIKRWLFVACPIVPGDGPVSTSWKHYRPQEHCWYWTRRGLVEWMHEYGFRCLCYTTEEVRLGREDIGTFVFERVLP